MFLMIVQSYHLDLFNWRFFC